MNTILLVIDIILAVVLTALVLLQRSEGGALGGLAGAGGSSMFTGRQAGNMLTRLTWWSFALFVVINLALVILSKRTEEVQPISLVPTEQSQQMPTSNALPMAPIAPASDRPANNAAPAAPAGETASDQSAGE